MQALLYLFSIVAVNASFAWLPMVTISGAMVPPAAVLAGAVFMARDLAQRRHGHGVLAVMAIGIALSWWLASPAVAVASGLSFAVSELLDWAVYTVADGSFRRRIVLSSLLAVPVDTVLFLGLAIGWHAINPVTVGLMIGAKLTPLFITRWI